MWIVTRRGVEGDRRLPGWGRLLRALDGETVLQLLIVREAGSAAGDKRRDCGGDSEFRHGHFLRMSGVMYCRSENTAPWGLALPALKDCIPVFPVAPMTVIIGKSRKHCSTPARTSARWADRKANSPNSSAGEPKCALATRTTTPFWRGRFAAEVLEEPDWTKEQHIRAVDPLQTFFLRVQARDHAGAFAQVCADAAQRDDVSHAALADGVRDGLALEIPSDLHCRAAASIPPAIYGRAKVLKGALYFTPTASRRNGTGRPFSRFLLAAFSRAFKRFNGVPPGVARRSGDVTKPRNSRAPARVSAGKS
jgi:hypothetical protein